MQDPYELLGVPRNASMDDIKKAYRTLSRKYHPDANINNPNKAAAEEKFKQIQQAYQQIVDEKENGTSWSGSSSHGTYGSTYGTTYGDTYSGSGSTYQEDDVELRAAANYINSRHYREAMNVLNRMNGSRSGTWYYLHAIANAGLGNNADAVEDAERAVQMEPNNPQFRQLLSQLSGGAGWYSDMGSGYGYNTCSGSNVSKVCCACCAIQALCACCSRSGYGGYGCYPCLCC